MRFSLLALTSLTATLLFAQDKPLTTLPYTPSLDTQFMDRSADPCVDFYKFACGNWNKLNPIPADQGMWNVYSKLTDENLRFLWGILEQAAQQSPARTPNEQKIGDFFHACMDESAIEAAGARPLEPMLQKIANLKTVDDIAGYVAVEHTSDADAGVLFGFDSEQDYDNSSQVIAFARAGGLGLPDRDYYTKTDAKAQETRQRYVQHLQRMLELMGEPATDAQADARAIMSVETALAQASLTRVEQRNPYNLKHRLSLEDLIHMVPQFNWAAYFGAIPAPTFETVNVTEPKFFDELNKELRDRNLATWKAYLRWHLVHARAPYLASKFVQENFDFYGKYLTGATQIPPRWKRCTRLVDRDLGEAFGTSFRPTILDCDSATQYPTEFAQSLLESGNMVSLRRQRGWAEKPESP